MMNIQSTSSGIRIASWNVNGLYNKTDVLRKIKLHADIWCLNETWMRSDSKTKKPWITEHKCAPLKKNGKTRGGVAMMISSLLAYRRLASFADEHIQWIAIQVGEVVIVNMYVSPSTKAQKLIQMISIMKTLGNRIIIIGDLNCRHKRWDTRNNSLGIALYKETTKTGWKIHSTGVPTCYTRNGSSSVDLAMTRKVNICTLTTIEATKNLGSDHIAIQTALDIQSSNAIRESQIPISQRTETKYITEAKEFLLKELENIEKQLQQVDTTTKLETLYQEFTHSILKPWQNARTRGGKGIIRNENPKIRQLKKKRSKIYNKAKRTQDQEHWEEYVNIDKSFKMEIKKWKKIRREKRYEQLQNSKSMTETMRRVNCIIREYNREQNKTVITKEVDPKEFTDHINTKPGRGHSPTRKPFRVDEDFVQQVEKAISRSPSGKSSGTDGLFVEAFRIQKSQVARILSGFWQKCSDLTYILQDWNMCTLVPLYKKGETNKPSSYRPIAIVSHAKKVIEKAIGYQIKKQTKFDQTQVGFLEKTSTETAILRTANHFKHGRKYIAVLDLKSAYTEVPRDKLIEVISPRLTSNTTNMITLCLQPLLIQTKGDHSKKQGLQTRGVTQGSPLSPTLYNLYMDTYPQQLRQTTSGEMKSWSVDLFADDVKLQTTKPETLQTLLDTSTKWADDMGMTWAPQKCTIITPKDETHKHTFHIANTEMIVKDEAEYLGMSINSEMITSTRNIQRIRKAKNISQLLYKTGMSIKNMVPRSIKNIHNCFVYGTASYGIHLAPPDKEFKKVWKELDECQMRNTMGAYTRRFDKKLRKISRTPNFTEVTGMMLHSLERRLHQKSESSEPEDPPSEEGGYLKQYRKDQKLACNLTKRQLYHNWNNMFKHHQRKMSNIQVSNYLPFMSKTKDEYATTIVRWYMGTFPINPRECILRGGNQVERALETMRRIASLEEWIHNEEEEIKQAIDLIKRFQPSSWKVTTHGEET